MTSLQKVLTNTQRKLKENSWFSGLFDNNKFIPKSSPQDTYFQKISTNVVGTDSIDTYDLVFNLQMPSLANTPWFSYAENKNTIDYYCHLGLSLSLSLLS